MDESNILLAKKIKSIRLDKGYTREFVCNNSGIHVDTLRRIEKGENIPRIDTLNLLSRIYGVNLILLINSHYKNPYILKKLREISLVLHSDNCVSIRNELDKDLNEAALSSNSKSDYVQIKCFIECLKESKLNKNNNLNATINKAKASLCNKYGKIDFNNLYEYNFNYLERRILYLIASMLIRTKNYIESNSILNFLDITYENLTYNDIDEMNLNIEVKYSLSLYYKEFMDYENTLKYANRAIDLCTKYESSHILHVLLYIKGLALYSLKDPNYTRCFENCLNQLDILYLNEEMKKYTYLINEVINNQTNQLDKG